MNLNAQVYDQYRKTSVETVTPQKLLLMLYNGAIKNIYTAGKAVEEKDINLAHQEIIKAQDIILELMSTLNMDHKISNSLMALYEYLYNQLVRANLKKDGKILEEVMGFLMELRDVWQEAIKSINPGSRAAQLTVSGDMGIKSQSPMLNGINVKG